MALIDPVLQKLHIADMTQAALQTAIHRRLADDVSIEITAGDLDSLGSSAAGLPRGTPVSVTFLPAENFRGRVAAAALVRRLGLVPVPHLSARRLHSHAELEGFLAELRDQAQIEHAFVVGGDLPEPMGCYEDALAIIQSGLLQKYGIRCVGIAGYPEGHPAISDEQLWAALLAKCAALKLGGMNGFIMTQFGFDAAPVLDWVAKVRAAGIELPIRVGVAGPASIKTLLRFAARCGVATSASVMAKYGLSITRLLGTAGPDSIVLEFERGYDPAVHGEVGLHFYPFGGVGKTVAWIKDYARTNR